MSVQPSSLRSEMWKGLIWKETRQLLPLMLILIGVCVLLIVLWSGFISLRLIANQVQYMPLILPALFAVGAAAVLVGQEREQRTLWWLASLPVPPPRLILVKFVAAISGLGLMWLLCWTLMFLINFTNSTSRGVWLPFSGSPELVDICFLHLHSAFILVCGFYAAWKLKNTFASLIAIVLLASIPFLIIEAWYFLREQLWGYRYVGLPHSAATTMLVTIPTIAIVGWLAYRAASRSLAPAEPPSLTTRSAVGWIDAWRAGASSPAPVTPYRFSISSLVWQSIHHNRLALAGIVTMILTGFVGLLVVSSTHPKDLSIGFVIFCSLVAALGTSWLGLFVFTGDGSGRQLRFLAERGISPTTVLMGRHLVGLSILSSLVLLYAWCSYQLPNVANEASLFLPSAAAIAVVVWVVYATSQWTSQLVPSLAAAAILAPVLSFFAVYWLGFSAIELDSPLWLIVFAGSLPMVGTWLMMQRYMDGSRRWMIWLAGVVTAGLFWLLPAVPLAIEVAQIPTMPAAVRSSLEAEAEQISRNPHVRSPLPVTLTESPGADRDFYDELTGEKALKELDQRSFRPTGLLSIPPDDSTSPLPFTIDSQALQHAISSATYEKLRFQSSPKDESAIDSLGEWIGALTVIARGLRRSTRWDDQESADIIEIWLTQSLASPPVSELRDRQFYQEALELISDAKSRSDGRRRAVLVSWHQWQLITRGRLPYVLANIRSISNLANMALLQRKSISDTQHRWMQTRLTEAIIYAIIRLIEEGSSGRPTEAVRRELHELVMGSRMDFVDGPYSDRLRVGADTFPPFLYQRYPASQWYAPWEEDASRLANSRQQSVLAPVSAGVTP
jgi:hypothetical protein